MTKLGRNRNENTIMIENKHKKLQLTHGSNGANCHGDGKTNRRNWNFLKRKDYLYALLTSFSPYLDLHS